MTLIPNDELREAVLDSGVPLYQIARHLGQERTAAQRHRGRADTSRLRRALGISHNMRDGQPYRQERIRVQTAERICYAAGLDPYQAGL